MAVQGQPSAITLVAAPAQGQPSSAQGGGDYVSKYGGDYAGQYLKGYASKYGGDYAGKYLQGGGNARGQPPATQGQQPATQGQPSAAQGQQSAVQGQPSAAQGQPSSAKGQPSAVQGGGDYASKQVQSSGTPKGQPYAAQATEGVQAAAVPGPVQLSPGMRLAGAIACAFVTTLLACAAARVLAPCEGREEQEDVATSYFLHV